MMDVVSGDDENNVVVFCGTLFVGGVPSRKRSGRVKNRINVWISAVIPRIG